MTRQRWSRRCFLSAAGALGASGVLHPRLGSSADAAPETRRIRLARASAICFAPIFVAGDGLLQAEGISDVAIADARPTTVAAFQEGIADIGATDVPTALVNLDKDADHIVVLGGMHSGCYELFSAGNVRSIRELKGKSIAVPGLGSGRYLTLSAMLSHVGLNPRKDVNWVSHPAPDAIRLLAEEKVDAFLGFPPEPQELRARKIGRLILSTTTDRPWSGYYCCVIVARRDFVRSNPVATKLALRAILKAAALCTNEPARATQTLVKLGLTQKYEYALEMMKELPYSRWRAYDTADSMRFYALRLLEAGLIRSTPQSLIARGADLRFLDQLKGELKA